MAIIIERQVPFHFGFGRARHPYAGCTTCELHVGFLAIAWFRGSLVDLVNRWSLAMDHDVERRVERALAAESAGRSAP